MLNTRALVCLLCVSTLTACGGDSKPPTAPTPPTPPSAPGQLANLSGQWHGTIEVPVMNGSQVLFYDRSDVTLDLNQTELNVTGTLRLRLFHDDDEEAPELPGTLTGTLSAASAPTTMQMRAFYQTTDGNGPAKDCQGSLTGTLNVNTGEIEGALDGHNCVSVFTGKLRATKNN
jgi:hypothetical protein